MAEIVYTRANPLSGVIGLVYIIIGVVVASSNGYLGAVFSSIPHLLSAFLAILLWPAILLGANLHLGATIFVR
ncbi:MAG TPA: hypothetical protein VLG47_07715 [Candidatus Saccharimonadales bacterium]|nr:hypothetical protein [Candidatus Saccharimonadales bacterium]